MPDRKQIPPDAENLAIQALSWLAAEPERMGLFLAATGLEPQHVRRAAAEPGFFGAVLDHILAEEARLLEFASSAGIDPAAIPAARRRLPGAGGEEG